LHPRPLRTTLPGNDAWAANLSHKLGGF